MITSFIDGRVRIRAEALRDEGNMALVLAVINAQEGVTEVVSNPRTGSILVHYDPEKIPRETLLEAAAALEQQLAPMAEVGTRKSGSSFLAVLSCRGNKKGGRISPLSPLAESALMAGLLLLTVVTGYTNKKSHFLMAASFAGLAGIHMYDRRRCLKP